MQKGNHLTRDFRRGRYLPVLSVPPRSYGPLGLGFWKRSCLKELCNCTHRYVLDAFPLVAVDQSASPCVSFMVFLDGPRQMVMTKRIVYQQDGDQTVQKTKRSTQRNRTRLPQNRRFRNDEKVLQIPIK
eukprot:1658813-Amphidinium_carterae.1